MKAILFLPLLPLLLCLPTHACPSPPLEPERLPERPVDVFADLEGSWAGKFVGYDMRGKELYRIEVEQSYRIVDDNSQEVRIRDRMPDGKLITGKGLNIARESKDGGLELFCRVEKSNGEKVEHRGRLVQGPMGDKQIVWYSADEKQKEVFREWVEPHGKAAGTKAIYHIQGMGRYGKTLMLMAGAYSRKGS